MARECFLGSALEHREKAFSRIRTHSHESGAMRVVESGELLSKRGRFDEEADLLKLLSGQEEDGGSV